MGKLKWYSRRERYEREAYTDAKAEMVAPDRAEGESSERMIL